MAGSVLLICISCVKEQGSGQGRKAVKRVKWRIVCRSLLSTPLALILLPTISGNIHTLSAWLYLIILNISNAFAPDQLH